MAQLDTPIRRNDTVIVTAGKDRGKRGRVLKVLPAKNRLVVEGVNMIKRHTKPNPGRNIKGGIVEREASLHASNVQLVCPECGARFSATAARSGFAASVRESSTNEPPERPLRKRGRARAHERVRLHQ